MNRVLAFLLGLVVVLSLGWGIGRAAGPSEAGPTSRGADHGGSHGADHGDDHAGMDMSAAEEPGGLAVAQDGYRLDLAQTVLRPGTRTVSFRILDKSGEPLTAYDVRHDKRLHLVVVRRDTSGFQHVHPTLDQATGVWSAPVRLTAGGWRVFADFVPAGGDNLVLGADLAVPGLAPTPPPEPVTRTSRVGGYTVTVAGDLTAGEHSMLTLSVSKDGRPVRDLQPYLGAYGHLVTLRDGDLAYLHVHPDGEPGDGTTEPGPDVRFGAEVPSPGRYHLYLDFRHDGVVRTATFVLEAGAGDE